jgi:predicted SprT family Zn-dependent metalloprotease
MTDCAKWRKSPLINPATGRSIKLNGPTYNKLARECHPKNDPTHNKLAKDRSCDDAFLTLSDSNCADPAFLKFTRECKDYYPFTTNAIDGPIVRGSFAKNRHLFVVHYFRLFDATIFNNRLTGTTSVEFSNRLTTTGGKARYVLKNERERLCVIRLSTLVINSLIKLMSTMIHEMCHAIVWIHDGVFNAGHGPLWKKWTALAERTFPQLAPITTKHTYSTLRKAECEICKARHRPKNVHRVCGCGGKIVRVVPYVLRTP